MNSDQWMSLVRSLLKVAGGALLTHGATKAAGIVNAEDTVGLVMTIIGFVTSHFSHAAETPANGNGLTPKVGLLLLPLMALGLLLPGCASVAPGNDPLVVHVEQVQTVAHATFDTFLSIDNANRAFFKTNAPALHDFAEYLRAKVEVNGTNVYPRGDAYLLSLDRTKLAYKAGYTNSSGLMKALAAVQTAVSEAQQYISETATSH